MSPWPCKRCKRSKLMHLYGEDACSSDSNSSDDIFGFKKEVIGEETNAIGLWLSKFQLSRSRSSSLSSSIAPFLSLCILNTYHLIFLQEREQKAAEREALTHVILPHHLQVHFLLAEAYSGGGAQGHVPPAFGRRPPPPSTTHGKSGYRNRQTAFAGLGVSLQ